MERVMTKKLNQVLALMLTIAALMVGQTVRADQTWSVTNEGETVGLETKRHFYITRTETTTVETVKYRTISLTALAGKSFVEVTGEVTFNKGVSSQRVTLQEMSLEIENWIYRFGTPDMSRCYRFEVLDKVDGHELAHTDRVFDHSTVYDVDPTKMFQNVELTGFTDPVTVDDVADGFGQAYHEVNLQNLGFFTSTAPQNYLTRIGAKLAMSFDFQAKEIEDGYQYLQVIVNDLNNYDIGNQNGEAGNLYYAQLLAGFGHAPGKKNTHYAYYTFPVPADGDIAYGNHDGVWQQYGNTVGRLYSQKIKPGYLHTQSGRMLTDASIYKLVIRFDASGKHDDKWQVKDFKAHIQTIDECNPTVITSDVRLSPEPYIEGSTFYLTVPFSEIVQVPTNTTPTITTNWGDLTYYMGSGTNVLIFKGTIGTGDGYITPTDNLTITALSGGPVKDLRGNPFTGQENAINVTFPAQYTPQAWGTGDGTKDKPYIIYPGDGLNELVQCVNTLGIDFGPDASHPDGYFFKLGADITYNGSSVNNYTAIGNPTHPFNGNFDGNGHVISGINIYEPNKSYQGFFGYVVGGTIKNVIVDNSTIYNNGGDYAGAVVGCCEGGTVSGCFVYNTTVNCDGTHHGAVVGNNDATLERNYYRRCTVSDQTVQNVYTLGLGTDITASAPTITYNSTSYYVQGAQVTLTAPLGNGFDNITVTKDADASDVTTSVLNGTTIIMTDYDISVSATFTDLWGIGSGNDGSQEHPYIISNAAGWDALAIGVNQGETFDGKYVKLSDNFDNSTTPVTTMVGDPDHSFIGTFLGNGRTLTINMGNTTEIEGCAPFYKLDHALIEKLRVAGTITTDGKLAAGIASRMCSSKIWGCVSSVTIISSVVGDGTHGGLVAVSENEYSGLTGCVFDGVICCTAPNLTNSCAGFVGWCDKGGTGYTSKTDIIDCLYAPAAIPTGMYALDATNCRTFARENTELYGSVNISYTFYTETLGEEVQGFYPVNCLDAKPVNGKDDVEVDYGFMKKYETRFVGYNGKYYMQPPTFFLYEDGTGQTDTFKDGCYVHLYLSDRVLFKDGNWNTLCVPFSLSADQFATSALAGADIRTLSSASFNNGVLTLNFTDKGAINSIEAGVPYIIRWDKPDPYVRYNWYNNASTCSDIYQPDFFGVYIDKTQHDVTCDMGGGKSITFVGTRASKTYDSEDKSVLFLGRENKLYYPLAKATINAQRAYFQLNGITAGDINNTRMYFGEEDDNETTIENVQCSMFNVQSENIYNLSGQRLSKPQKGINIVNGKKILF